MALKPHLWALDGAPVKNSTAVLILVALADEAADDGTGACPYIEKLKGRGRTSERSVQNHLRDLYRMRIINLGDQAVAMRRYNKQAGHAPRVWDMNMSATWDNIPEPRTDAEMEEYSKAFAKGGRGKEQESHLGGVQNLHPAENDGVQNLHPIVDQGKQETGEVQRTAPHSAPGVQSAAPHGEGGVQPATDRGAAGCTSGVQPAAPFPNPQPQQHPFFGDHLPTVDGLRGDDGNGAAIQPTLTGQVAATPAAGSHDRAMGVARAWVEHRHKAGKPVAGRSPMHQVASLLKQFIEVGYDESELKRALNGLNRGIPSVSMMEAALIRVREGGQVQDGGRQGPSRAGANVNDYWDQVAAREAAKPAGTAEPAGAGVAKW